MHRLFLDAGERLWTCFCTSTPSTVYRSVPSTTTSSPAPPMTDASSSGTPASRQMQVSECVSEWMRWKMSLFVAVQNTFLHQWADCALVSSYSALCECFDSLSSHPCDKTTFHVFKLKNSSEIYKIMRQLTSTSDVMVFPLNCGHKMRRDSGWVGYLHRCFQDGGGRGSSRMAFISSYFRRLLFSCVGLITRVAVVGTLTSHGSARVNLFKKVCTHPSRSRS